MKTKKQWLEQLTRADWREAVEDMLDDFQDYEELSAEDILDAIVNWNGGIASGYEIRDLVSCIWSVELPAKAHENLSFLDLCKSLDEAANVDELVVLELDGNVVGNSLNISNFYETFCDDSTYSDREVHHWVTTDSEWDGYVVANVTLAEK